MTDQTELHIAALKALGLRMCREGEIWYPKIPSPTGGFYYLNDRICYTQTQARDEALRNKPFDANLLAKLQETLTAEEWNKYRHELERLYASARPKEVDEWEDTRYWSVFLVDLSPAAIAVKVNAILEVKAKLNIPTS